MTLLLNRELVSRAKLRFVSVFPDIFKERSKIRNLPKTFLRSVENVATAFYCSALPEGKAQHTQTSLLVLGDKSNICNKHK